MKTILGLLLIVFITSCSTSNDVASHRGVQKRKYTKGFFITKNTSNFNHKIKTTHSESETVSEDVAEVEEHKDKTQNEIYITQNETIDSYQNDGFNLPLNNTLDNEKPIRSNNVKTEENKTIVKNVISNKKNHKQSRIKHSEPKISYGGLSLILLIIIAFLLPPLAVAIATQLDIGKTLLCLLLTILFYIPGLIYALIIITRYN